MSEMILLKRFNTLEEAFMARAMLDSAGIDALIPDEYTLQNSWLWITAYEGVRLMVAEDSIEEARAILQISTENQSPYLSGFTCPACGSQRVINASLRRRSLAAIIAILHIPLPFRRDKYECADCGHHWK
ncbi:DUF2007 domain-containing protein [Kamptonema cortianum]|nr:DUF2007 domain-containing protein [Oscillatoria laete-virens]MDK3159557.1 DUF2007 domain-containing protein [Kamptonema cortianum]MDL5053305.1 DUF2007 domain-containing protein [Oscillatoria laete-virens NRMC-F 0139]